MKALDVAYAFVNGQSNDCIITNLKLNKLVYFAQVLSLKQDGIPLFSDSVEAWEYGPVVRDVYQRFKRYGSAPIPPQGGSFRLNARSQSIVNSVADRYACLTAFDLVELSHKKGGAWSRAYSPNRDNVISHGLILESNDLDGVEGELRSSFASALDAVDRNWPNAMRMLEDA